MRSRHENALPHPRPLGLPIASRAQFRRLPQGRCLAHPGGCARERPVGSRGRPAGSRGQLLTALRHAALGIRDHVRVHRGRLVVDPEVAHMLRRPGRGGASRGGGGGRALWAVSEGTVPLHHHWRLTMPGDDLLAAPAASTTAARGCGLAAFRSCDAVALCGLAAPLGPRRGRCLALAGRPLARTQPLSPRCAPSPRCNLTSRFALWMSRRRSISRSSRSRLTKGLPRFIVPPRCCSRGAECAGRPAPSRQSDSESWPACGEAQARRTAPARKRGARSSRSGKRPAHTALVARLKHGARRPNTCSRDGNDSSQAFPVRKRQARPKAEPAAPHGPTLCVWLRRQHTPQRRGKKAGVGEGGRDGILRASVAMRAGLQPPHTCCLPTAEPDALRRDQLAGAARRGNGSWGWRLARRMGRAGSVAIRPGGSSAWRKGDRA